MREATGKEGVGEELGFKEAFLRKHAVWME
jgi:hypothetical protein